MYLYTENGNNRIELLYGCVIGVSEWRDRAFMYEVNLESLLSYAASHTTFKSETQYVQGDRAVAMSTCSCQQLTIEIASLQVRTITLNGEPCVRLIDNSPSANINRRNVIGAVSVPAHFTFEIIS